MNSTGQYYFNARWYDPNLGRFTTEDPIKSGLNWYVYANNNPLRFVDPTGLELYLASGSDLAFHFPYGSSSFAGEPKKNENGLVQWDHKGTYVIQETFWSKSMIGKFFGAQPKILGTIENPTLKEKNEFGLDPLGLSPILKDLDGNFLKTFHDAVKDDKNADIAFDAIMFGTDIIGNAFLAKNIGKAALEGGAKSAAMQFSKGIIGFDDLKNLTSENLEDSVISSLPVVDAISSGMNLYNEFIDNGISDREAFDTVMENSK